MIFQSNQAPIQQYVGSYSKNPFNRIEQADPLQNQNSRQVINQNTQKIAKQSSIPLSQSQFEESTLLDKSNHIKQETNSNCFKEQQSIQDQMAKRTFDSQGIYQISTVNSDYNQKEEECNYQAKKNFNTNSHFDQQTPEKVPNAENRFRTIPLKSSLVKESFRNVQLNALAHLERTKINLEVHLSDLSYKLSFHEEENNALFKEIEQMKRDQSSQIIQ